MRCSPAAASEVQPSSVQCRIERATLRTHKKHALRVCFWLQHIIFVRKIQLNAHTKKRTTQRVIITESVYYTKCDKQ